MVLTVEQQRMWDLCFKDKPANRPTVEQLVTSAGIDANQVRVYELWKAGSITCDEYDREVVAGCAKYKEAFGATCVAVDCFGESYCPWRNRGRAA